MKTTQFSASWLRFSILLLFFWSALPFEATAQWTNYFGTPQVYAIAMDAQGNQWFGTNTGVWKFDGTNYTSYHPTNSGLGSSDVRAITVDAQGNKWFGTADKGVFKFDGTTWTNYNSSNSVLNNDVISAIIIDGQGDKWFANGGYNGGISKLSGTTWTNYTANTGLTSNDFKAAAIDAQGKPWFVTDGGGVANFGGSTWTTYNTSNSGLVSNYVRAVAIDAQGNKWFGTYGGGVSKFDGSTWTTYTTSDGLANNQVYSIAVDAQGNKWFGGSNSLSKFDDATWTNQTSSIGFETVYAIAIDAQGNKWFGKTTGVSKLAGTTWTTHSPSNSGLLANSINTVTKDPQGGIWAATPNGVTKYDGTSWTTYNSATGVYNVWSIAIDSQGNKWFGTNGYGVVKFDGTTWTTYRNNNSGLVANNVKAIAIDAQGNKWFGTYGSGVSKFNGTTWTTYRANNSGITDDFIHAITIDAQGNLWFGTGSNGVTKFDGTTWTNYKPTNSGIGSYGVQAIAIDAQGIKWFAGADGGVSKWDGTTWTIYNTTNSGLVENSVNTVAIDAQGNKWFGFAGNYNGGVSKFDGTTWTSYNPSNSSLPHKAVRRLVIDAQGNKWFATATGLSKYASVACNLSVNITRNGTDLTAIPTGGTAPFTYSWNNQATSATLQNVNAGLYTVTVTDALGCTATTSFSNCQVTNSQNRLIRQGNSVVVNGHTYNATGTYQDTILRNGLCDSIIVTNLTVVNCNLTTTITQNNTTLTANPTGGYAPYTYAWSNQATTATLQNVSSGVYSVTITDSIGCTTTASLTVSAQPVSAPRYQLQVTDAQCGGAQPATLHLNMNTTRSCMDALMVKLQFDTTKVFFDNNLTIQKGAAIDTSGRVFYSINRDTLLITVDLTTGCIQGDSGTNVLRLPFRLRPTFALPRATSAFNLTVMEERVVSNAVRDTTSQPFGVSGTLVGKVQVFRPNGNVIRGTTNPITVFVGDTCGLLNSAMTADSNANAVVRLDSFRYVRFHRAPPTIASPLIGGFDVFLMRSYLHGTQSLTARQKIAADVNNDGVISTLDITILRRRAISFYASFAEASAGRLTSDYQFTLQNSDTPKVCFRLPALAADCDTPSIQLNMITLGDINGDTDTTTIAGGIRDNGSNGVAKLNKNLILQLCRATRVGNEWKIPVFSDAVTRGLDLQLLSIPDTGIFRVESANPTAFEVSANGRGVGNNYYMIGYANNLQGISANDTLLYLYVKTATLLPQQLGNLKGYLDAQEVNTQKLVCTPTSDLYTNPYEVYPNPTTNSVQMTTQQPLSEPTTLRIYDMLGRCVKTQVLQRGETVFTIEMADLAHSVYQFHFSNQYKKVVKQ